MFLEAFLLLLKESVDRILSLNVNAADSGLENADLGAVAAGFDNAGLFLDAYDLADDTADRGDLVTDLKIVAHSCSFLFLLSLTASAEEKDRNKCHDHDNCHDQTAAVVRGGLCKQKSCIEHNVVTLS